MGDADFCFDVFGKFGCADEAHGFCVFVVVTEVGDAVGVLDEASFEGAGFEFAAVVEDAVFDLDGEVQSSSVAFEFVDDADALFVVFEVAGDFLQGLFSYVAEGGMAEVMA